MPSASAAFTSARCLISARTASRFPCFTASMTPAPPAASRLAAQTAATRMTHRTRILRSPSEVHGTGAQTERLDLHTELLPYPEHEVGERGLLRCLDVAISLDASRMAADEQRRHVEPQVVVALAHAAAPDDERMIEQRAVPVRGGTKTIDEFREQHHVPGVQ